MSSEPITTTDPSQTTSNGNGKDEIAHVLFLDIIGFTRLRPAKQRLVLGKLQDVVRETSDFCEAKAKRELLALPTGDGMALVFLTARGGSGPAISCAEKIAGAVFNYNKDNQEDSKIKLRMGIHSGNVVRISDVNNLPNVAGEGINTAQRVMDCGDWGHILISDMAFRLMPAEPDRTDFCAPFGNVRVKHDQEVNIYSLIHENIGNQATPQRIVSEQTQASKDFELIAAKIRKEGRRDRIRLAVGICLIGLLVAATAYITSRVLASGPTPTFAVLPFQPSAPQTNSSKAISKGLTEQFIRNFSALAAIVPKTESSFKSPVTQDLWSQKKAVVPSFLPEKAKSLNVRFVLFGIAESTTNDPNLDHPTATDPSFGVTVHAALYDGEADAIVWRDEYDSKRFYELPALQNTIMRAVTQKMGVPMTDPPQQIEQQTRAHWLYMQGRFWSTERPRAEDGTQKPQEVADKAIQSYKEAIKLDPTNVLAQAGLVDVYSSISGSSKPPEEALREALNAIDNALERPESRHTAEVYAAIGTVKWWLERDFVGAVIAFDLAKKINPQLADVHKRYSSYLAVMGKHAEARQAITDALNLEPDSSYNLLSSGMNSYFEHDYETAVTQLRLVTKTSKMSVAHRFLAMALYQSLSSQSAEEQLKRRTEISERLQDAGGSKSNDTDVLAAFAYIRANAESAAERSEALSLALKLDHLRDDKTSHAYISPYNVAVSYAGIEGKEIRTLELIKEAIDEFDPRVAWLRVDPRFDTVRGKKGSEFNALLDLAAAPVRIQRKFKSDN